MKKTVLALAVLSAVLLLAACGDGSDVTDAPATDAPVTTEPSVTTDAAVTTEIPDATDEPAEDTSENSGFDLPMVPV